MPSREMWTLEDLISEAPIQCGLGFCLESPSVTFRSNHHRTYSVCEEHKIEFMERNRVENKDKEEKMEFKVRTFAYKGDRCDRRSCNKGSTIAFPITPTEHIWLCDTHGKHLKALVEGQDKGQHNPLLEELEALCNRYRGVVKYCQECGNIKEG